MSLSALVRLVLATDAPAMDWSMVDFSFSGEKGWGFLEDLEEDLLREWPKMEEFEEEGPGLEGATEARRGGVDVPLLGAFWLSTVKVLEWDTLRRWP